MNPWIWLPILFAALSLKIGFDLREGTKASYRLWRLNQIFDLLEVWARHWEEPNTKAELMKILARKRP